MVGSKSSYLARYVVHCNDGAAGRAAG